MARLTRITPSGVPIHVIQRGNNRQVIFAEEADFKAYLAWLKEYSEKHNVQVYAWCLMTNHVHLLCAGMVDEEGIGKMMQSLGRQYVRYFNQKYNRTGTLWEGRFKSCLVEADNYLFELYRYIELNPVRAKMVEDPAEYIWSSYQINALERKSELLTPHPLYLQLGKSAAERKQNYRKLFEDALRETVLEEIRQAVNRGMAVGSDRFKEEIEALTGRRLKENKRGRPVGWRKLDNRKI